MTKLIILDLDGTLLDTIYDLAHSCNYALQLHGYPTHEVEAYRYFVGSGMNRLIERALPESARKEDTILNVKKDFLAYYSAHSMAYTQPYPGILELLEILQKKGIALAVASNKIDEATRFLIQRFFSHISFVAVFGQRENIAIKPDPAIVNDILAKAGVQKEETLYVGDSGVDVDTAMNAEVPFVGVLWGFRPKAELESKGAKNFISKPIELLEFIKQ